MKNKIDIQNEIEKTLNSLDSFPKQKAKPFMYTRIQAKLEQPENLSILYRLFDIPYLKPVLAGMLFLINTITILQISNIDSSAMSSEQTALELFTEEYAFNQSSDYLLNIENE